MGIDKLVKPGGQRISPETRQILGGVIEKLTPEAVNTIVSTVRDVVQTNAVLALKDQEFNHLYQNLMQKHNNRKEVLATLINLLSNKSLPDSAVTQIISSVCSIAERVNE